MEDFLFKTRTQGAVDSERMQLLSIIAHYWEELESYEYIGGTQKQKWDLWEMIGNEFNSHPHVTVTRTPLQVKTLFKNMKSKARKYKHKLEISKDCGKEIESDPVSETVLQLSKDESKDTLRASLDSLKTLRYFSSQNLSVDHDEGTELINSNSCESLDSIDWRMVMDSEEVPDIKEEVIEAFDSPCIIREDESPISFPVNDDRSDHSSEGQLSPSDNNGQTSPDATQEPSEIHTFGDISVTAIASEKKNTENGTIKVLSPVSLGLSVKHHSRLVSDTSTKESDSISDLVNLQPSTFLNASMAVGLANLMENNSLERTQMNIDNSNFENPSSNNFFNKKDNAKSCCCPEYHKQMINLAHKEHEMNISLLNEKFLAKREELRLHEEERQFREQNFLLKQELRKASLAEHQARMKLIELECEEAQKEIRNNAHTNKWLLKNGTKEI